MASAVDAFGAPKYVGAVGDDGEVHEARAKPPKPVYLDNRVGNGGTRTRPVIAAKD